MSLNFRLFTFLSRNTLSRKHDVGILFTWALHDFQTLSIICVLKTSLHVFLISQLVRLVIFIVPSACPVSQMAAGRHWQMGDGLMVATGGDGGSRLWVPLERGCRVLTAMFFILFNYKIW